jgi:DNA-binding transcriptional regulator YiaG
MAKAGNSRELGAKMSPESRARVGARVKETLENMSLDRLRAARELTQEHLAASLGINQAFPKWNGAATCISARFAGSLKP